MSHPYERLRSMNYEELVAEHDRLAESTIVGISYYLAELERRDRDRQADEMVRLAASAAADTAAVTRLTWVIAALTAINAVAAVVGAVRAGG